MNPWTHDEELERAARATDDLARNPTVKLFHSSELNADAYASDDATADDFFAPGWWVAPFIPEGAIIDHRLRGPFATTAEAFAMQARIEWGKEW